MSIAPYLSDDIRSSVDFASFLNTFRHKLRTVFRERGDFNAVSVNRGLPPYMLREVQSATPLAAFIPEEYGGRGGHIHECQAILAAASYESLALSLTFGINGALFLQPVTKYANEDVKGPIFERFLKDKNMGGLMITEPEYGTDALNMKTSYVETENGYHLEGIKHWAGLTGWADFWLLTARRQSSSGQLSRDIDFFIADMNQPAQMVEVEEMYENLGLYLIPYGRNRLDLTVPTTHRLEPESTGIKMMLDTLHRSRIEFPGMGMGFLKRILDESLAHCKERFVGTKSLFDHDQVQKRLAWIQAAFTACSAMCLHTSETAQIENNMASSNLAPNATKAVVTDLMQDAAQSFLQLSGGKGYRLDHPAGRATVDSRPFQIFEGSNDVLYQQITETVLKSMRRAKESNLGTFLSDLDAMHRAADRFGEALDFSLDSSTLSQRKSVELGRALGRITIMEYIIELGDRGFRSDLISNALHVMEQEVHRLLCSYQRAPEPLAVDAYDDEESSWLNFVSA